MKNKSLLGSLLLSLSASIWGGMFVVVKIVVNYIPPVELVLLRYLVAIVILVLVSWLKKEKWIINKADLGLIFLIGLMGNTISILAQETGTWLSNAQTGAVITSSTPTFMILFAWWLLKEKLTKVKLLSVIMATIGVFCIVGMHLTGQHVLWGVLSLILAALTWALMSVLIKRLSGNYSPLQVTIMSTLVAIFCLSPVMVINRQVFMQIAFLNPIIIACLLYLGVVSTALAFVLWNQGLHLVSAGSSGLFFLLQPIVGTLLGWLFLHERLTWGFLIGSLLIIGSVWVAIRFED